MLNQRLQQRLQQKLSPQQIQMIKLLELPALQLEQRVKKELEENPALEEGAEKDDLDNSVDENNENDSGQDEFSVEDYIPDDDDIPDYKLKTKNYSKDDEHKDIPVTDNQSFLENLSEQLALKDIDERTFLLSKYLLGNLDESGYLRRELESIVDDLAFSQNIVVEQEELEKALNLVQSLDPPGIGARNLKECLLIQIKKKDIITPLDEIAIDILENYFEEFTKKHYTKILNGLKIEESELKDAVDIITKLNPKPGGVSGSSAINTIIPDFIVNIRNGEIELNLTNRNAPVLHVNNTYTEMLKSYQNKKKTKKDKEAIMFVKQKLDSAKWFIDAVKQRQNTLLLTMQAIINHQKDFFLEGDESLLRPMILKDIADVTGLDISTISRVANSKFVQTPYGNFKLKYFFSEGMKTEDGKEVSTIEVKRIIQNLIDEEDKKKPYTDEKLTDLLKEKGYKIARRTVAKYREQLNLPVGRLRKEL